VATLLISELHVVASPLSEVGGTENTLLVLQALHAVNVFFQSGLFASGAKFLQVRFRPAHLGRALVMFAIGGRLGGIAGIIGMGLVVTHRARESGWQLGSRIAAILCFAGLLPIAILKLCPLIDEESAVESKIPPTPIDEELAVKWKIMAASQHPRDLKCRGQEGDSNKDDDDDSENRGNNNSSHPMTDLVRVLDIVVSFLGNNKETSTVILSTTSLIAGGILVQTFVAGQKQTQFVLLSLSLACLASGALIGLTASSSATTTTTRTTTFAWAGRVVYFLVGFGLGYPYFVTVPKFAIRFGGAFSGLVIQILSLFALAVCAAVDGAIGILVTRASSWTVAASLVFAFTVVALGAMSVLAFFEWRARFKLKQLNLQAALREMMMTRSSAVIPLSNGEKSRRRTEGRDWAIRAVDEGEDYNV